MSAPYEGLGVFYLGRAVDAATGEATPAPVLYDAQDLTTHAFIVGMTGSGKTGLGVSLLEEAALDGVPVIAIDPKGDLANLALTFPSLAHADFAPWVDPAAAQREGLSVDDLAARTATQWRDGLAAWDQPAERIQRLRDAAEVTVYTPGASAGVAVSVLGALAPPPAGADPGAPGQAADTLRDRVDSTVGSVLSLLGIEADPLASPEHVFLARVVADAWAAGRTLAVTDLIRALQAPPFETLGVMPVDDFFPAKQRQGLAMRLNGLVASPGFAAWTEGEALDAGRLLYTDAGKPRVAVMSIAHLSDAERMFFVTRLLGEVVGWMRAQPGTSSLRAILYMDEIFGYLPPTAAPPSKTLLLTLLKQARAFGLGVVLATQNPVDLDYKALANCGTWFVGRLQTERDKARLLDGLEGAAPGADRSEMDRILSGIGKRQFLMHNVHDSGPTLVATRWAMSFLAGPLTREQIATVMADRKPAPATGAPTATAPVPASPATPPPASPVTLTSVPPPIAITGSSRPALDGVPQVVLAGDADHYAPHLLARVEIPYRRASPAVDHTERLTLLAEAAASPDWSAADAQPERPEATVGGAEGATWGEVPAALTMPSAYDRLSDDLKRWVQAERPLTLFQSADPKAVSRPGESERDFRIRVADLSREARDARKADLRARFQTKLDAIQRRIETAEEAVQRESSQASRSTMDTALRVGTSLLGAFLGRRSARGMVSQIGTAARSAGRTADQRGDVARAEGRVSALQTEMAELEAQLTRELEAVDLAPSADLAPLTSVEIKAKAAELHVVETALAWVPYRRDADGRLTRA